MLKSVVVVLDDSESSFAAQTVALGFAREHGAELVGVGVVDAPFYTAPMVRPIGAGAYKVHRDESLLEEARIRLKGRINAFRDACAEAGAVHGAIGEHGRPHERIEAEADRHDLIVVGRDTNFHSQPEPDIAESVNRLLRDNPRPVLVVPGAPRPGNKVLIAFDGSRESSRAMHMFLLLGLARGHEIHVASIGEDLGEATALAERGISLYRSHGHAAEAHGLVARGSPAETLLAHVDAMNAGILVMGAFAHHNLLRNIFMGSATRRLLHDCPVPIFVHH